MLTNTLIAFLTSHQSLALITLFFGSFFDTFLFSSFFIYGEFFFIAGAILGSIGILNIWYVIIMLYIGGLLGDHTSYWIGRKYGNKLYLYLHTRTFLRCYFTEENYSKGVKLFDTYGGWSVFFGRFLGPLAWITPFFAGTFMLRYTLFTLADTIGVFLGIGQFIAIGYFFKYGYTVLLATMQQYTSITILLLFLVLGSIYTIRRFFKRRI